MKSARENQIFNFFNTIIHDVFSIFGKIYAKIIMEAEDNRHKSGSNL